MVFGITLIFLLLFYSIGNSLEPIKLLAIRHGSYPDEQRTRVAFDFAGGLPIFTQRIDLSSGEVHILFEKVILPKEMAIIYPVEDGRIDGVSAKTTETGIEALVHVPVPFTVTSGVIQNGKTVVYFDIKETISPGAPLSISPAPEPSAAIISGRIFDNVTGKALANVEVKIKEFNLISTTDKDGTYSFREVPSGTITMELYHPGYVKVTRAITVFENKGISLNIALNREVTDDISAPGIKPFPSAGSINRFQNQNALESFQLGEYHFQANHFPEAIAAYQKALEYDPAFVDAYYKLGISYGKSGESENGILALQEAIRLDPQNANAYNALGAIYGMLQQYGEAINLFNKAVEVNPQFELAYNNLGILYGKLGEHKKAIEALNRAIQINPKVAETYGALGVAYAMAGQPQDAIKPLLEAIGINPSYVRAYYNLGITYIWLGDIQRAREQYKKLIDLDQSMAQDLLQ